jgi:two-component system cell cycle sensor histidine kinase/response regulator CckA
MWGFPVQRRPPPCTGASLPGEYPVTNEKNGWNVPARLAERVGAAALELIAESVAFTDVSGRVRYVNRAYASLHGVEPDDMVGRYTSEFAADDESALQYRALQHARAARQGWTGDVANRRGSGGTAELRLAVSAVRDESGRLVGWIEVGRDVSTEHALEAQLRHAVKMEALGRLVSSVAHDFNNLLTVIRGYADLHRGDHEQSGEHPADLDEIVKAADCATELVGRLLATGRHSGARPQPLDLATVARGAEPLLRRLLGEDVNIRVTAELVPRVLAAPGHIEEILLNLAANARDAMPEGGTLSIGIEQLEIEPAVAPATFACGDPGFPPDRPGRYVVLSIADTGTGMDETTRARAFEPFFTTKAPGKGTGLGLASVLDIVRKSGGFVEVRSDVGRGTTIRILLPAANERAIDPETVPDACGHEGSHGRILLVDDDPSVLSFATRALERHGYEVHGFADLAGAMSHARSTPGRFDCIVADAFMSGLPRRSMPRHISESIGATPVLSMSGPGQTVRESDSFHSRIAKPFTACELAGAVRRTIEHWEGSRRLRTVPKRSRGPAQRRCA